MLTLAQRAFLLKPKALPTSTHFINLREVLPPSEWNRLRKKVYQAASHRCELCGIDAPLEAHEVWVFDFETKLQSLDTLVALCRHCHRIQHALLLKLQEDQGVASAWQTVKHFNKLTSQNLTPSQFYAQANKVHQELEMVEWEVTINKSFDELLM